MTKISGLVFGGQVQFSVQRWMGLPILSQRGLKPHCRTGCRGQRTSAGKEQALSMEAESLYSAPGAAGVHMNKVRKQWGVMNASGLRPRILPRCPPVQSLASVLSPLCMDRRASPIAALLLTLEVGGSSIWRHLGGMRGTFLFLPPQLL